MTCKKCFDEACEVHKAVRRWVGAWARERKRQGVSMFEPLKDKKAMEDAIEPLLPIDLTKCSCVCHTEED